MHPTVQAIYARVASIHPKTLHDYVLAQLPTAPQDAHPALVAFFTALTPPPLLHCVRCHKNYTDVENTGRACYVQHDDDEPEYELAYNYRSKWQTRWRCCDRAVDGYDGDEPEGGCFEGMHTTDRKRARFRADADSDDDKLVSCRDLGCRNIPASPVEHNTDVVEIVSDVGSLGNKGKAKGNDKSKAIESETRVAKPRAPARQGESNAESSGCKTGNVGAPAQSALKQHSDTKPRSTGGQARERTAAVAVRPVASSPPGSPRPVGRQLRSAAKMDPVEPVPRVTRSTRGRGGVETADEKTVTDVEGKTRKRRKVTSSAA
ncbi:hypothetical protein BC834DRAFT_154263 [Gloeopeniophorella convolvens]|nr:hypothetical protein BC834DRAFT_154263 [Gloeopeniophorella convolvens]